MVVLSNSDDDDAGELVFRWSSMSLIMSLDEAELRLLLRGGDGPRKSSGRFFPDPGLMLYDDDELSVLTTKSRVSAK